MPSEWQVVEIGSVCEGIYDGPHATPKKTAAGPVFLGISSLKSGRLDLSETEHLSEEDFVRWTRRVTPKQNDIVFSYETRLGEAAVIPAGLRCCLGRRMALMRVDETKAHPSFLLYAYLSPEFQQTIRARTVHGSTVPRIPLLEFEHFPIRLPPLAVQRDIAELLGAMDRQIDSLKEVSQALESMAGTIFKSWFVNFDPVRAKAEGREPEGMDAATAALFPCDFADIDSGEVPTGWTAGRLQDRIRVNPPRKLVQGATATYLDMANVPVSGPSPKGLALRSVGSGCKFANGDTLFAKITPCLENGKTAFVDFLKDGEIGWGSTELIVLSPSELIPPALVYLIARDPKFRTYAEQGMSGTSGRQRVPPEHLKSYPMIFATDDVYTAFGSIVDPMFRRIRANANMSATLTELRDTLLPRLISGKLRIPDAEKLVASAL